MSIPPDALRLAALHPTIMGLKCVWEFLIIGGLKVESPIVAQKVFDNLG